MQAKEFLHKHTYYVGLLVILASALSACSRDRDLPSGLRIDRNLPEVIDYNFHIKPILSDRCFNCHGPDSDNRKGDLRLDLAEHAYGLLSESGSGQAIVRGRPYKSVLITRILTDDPEQAMPPPESKLSLSDYEKALLFRWIDQGAEYKKHWAYIKPVEVEVPEGINPVDHFVEEAMEGKQLERNGRASPEALIRRAHFGLSGLPPSIEEISSFVNDTSPDAFEKVVDNLLSRPAYGERMSADWMDVARYADSDGYLDDKHRSFTPWRDWVINAFNANMPYDQFGTWQLAGDLIPDKTQESILATAFNRLHRRNSEAGIVFEEYRVEYVADKVHTMGTAFLGITAECARCHDHKYDPITLEDYYSLFAFFNQTEEVGTAIYGPDQTPGPSLLLTNDEQREVIEYLQSKAKKAKILMSDFAENVVKNESELTASVRKSYQEKLVAAYDFDELEDGVSGRAPLANSVNPNEAGTIYDPRLERGVHGKGFFVDDYNYAVLGDKVGWYDQTEPFTISLWIKPAENYDDAGIFSHCEDLRLGYKGYSLHLIDNRLRFIMARAWPYNAIEVQSDEQVEIDQWNHVAVAYNGSGVAEGVTLFLNGKPVEQRIISDNLYKTILFTPDIHTYGFVGLRIGYRDKVKNFKDGGIDDIRVFDDELTELELLYDFGDGDFTDAARDQITEFSRLNNPRYLILRDSFLAARTAVVEFESDIEEIMVMGDGAERSTFVLDRGNYDAPGKEVTPGVPEELGLSFEGFSADRLGLARWIFSPDNPLTARVFVNRIWQQHFGAGLVSTTEDFGAQGSLPSHPQMLDWLADYFTRSGWNIKALHKLIMMSDAYQRSAYKNRTGDLDPSNIYLSRGPSQRLSAEMIRDNALAVSGLLVDKIGGPSTYPYQPAGLWDEISNKSWRYKYLQRPGEGLYRRSLYTVWKRTAPPPSMLIFDAPDRDFCRVKRVVTNTPLQALVLLNDPQYIEACRALASKICASSETGAEKLGELFRRIIGRNATSLELELMLDYYHQELNMIASGGVDAQQYFLNGEFKATGKHDDELAAMAMVAHGLFNTYEGMIY